MLLISRPTSLRGLKEVRHSLMSWPVHSLFLCLVFIAVNDEAIASHRYVVENGKNIYQAMSESSEHTVAALSQRIER